MVSRDERRRVYVLIYRELKFWTRDVLVTGHLDRSRTVSNVF